MILHRTVILDAIWIILEIWRIGSSNLEGNFGGTLTISLSEFLQNKIGMVGAYRLGFIRGFRNAILVILAIWRNRSSNLEGNFGGTHTISLSEFLQNKIGMVGAYWLGFKRGFRNAIWIILAIWRIVPPIWRIILEELSLYLFLSSSKIK